MGFGDPGTLAIQRVFLSAITTPDAQTPDPFNRKIAPGLEKFGVALWQQAFPRIDDAHTKLKGVYVLVVDERSAPARQASAKSSLACPNRGSEQIRTLRIINAAGTTTGTARSTGWVHGSGNKPGHMATFTRGQRT
jgi:hypothetical protein